MYTDVLGLVFIHLAHGTLCDMQCCLVDIHTYQAVKALSPDLRVAGVLPNSLGKEMPICTATSTLNCTVNVCCRLQMEPEKLERKRV